MNGETLKLLEYERIIERLAGFAVSEPGKRRALELKPSVNKAVVETWLNETAEARAIVDCGSSVPLHSLAGIEDILVKPGLGMTLTPEELTQVGGLLAGGKRLKRFLQERKHLAPSVSSYALSLSELEDLAEEISRCIRGGLVDDKASPELGKLRKKISILEERIKSKLEAILKSPTCRPWLQDSLVSTRQGRYVIPVKSEYRRQVRGAGHLRQRSHRVYRAGRNRRGPGRAESAEDHGRKGSLPGTDSHDGAGGVPPEGAVCKCGGHGPARFCLGQGQVQQGPGRQPG